MSSSNSYNHHHQYYHYYQSLKLLLIAALLVVTPFLSSSLRFKYLYFIVNILIIAVGAEAGLVSFFLRSGETTKKPYFSVKENNNKHLFLDNIVDHDGEQQSENGARSVHKVFVEAAVSNVPKEADEKTPLPPSASSNPSIFFIGGGDQSENINITRDQELIVEDDDDEELFQKAEMFIGNFYKQLKMQRDESRKRLAD